jgi:hypothetical protein
VSRYALVFARAQDWADCLPDALLALATETPWVAYMTFDGSYLSDVNDRPGLEDDYDEGLRYWANTAVPALLSWLADWSGGRVVRIAQARTGSTWSRDETIGVDPAVVESMSTYGWPPTFWTAADRGADVRAMPWWVTHGYKEPFVTGHTPGLTSIVIAQRLRDAIGVAVEVVDEPFVPHRVRAHRLI